MKTFSIFALVAGLTATIPALAQTQVNAKDLTPEAIVSAVKAKSAGERQAYTAMVISAIASMPISDEEKIAKTISAARALIAGSKDGNTIGVIAEIYNSTPIQHLPAVAKMLAGNFDQELNGLSDEKMTTYIEKIVGRSSAYIEAAGCDSPAIRVGILASTFIDAATNKEAATATVAKVLPDSVRAAALAYAEDVREGDVETIAQGAGVDPEEIVETPETDPDADNIVQNPAVETATPTAEDVAANTLETEKDIADAKAIEEVVNQGDVAIENAADGDASEESAKVPLLSRFAKDVSGMLSDTIDSTLYDWEGTDLVNLPNDPLGASLLGLGNATVVPGDATVGGFVIDQPSSPLYDGQRN